MRRSVHPWMMDHGVASPYHHWQIPLAHHRRCHSLPPHFFLRFPSVRVLFFLLPTSINPSSNPSFPQHPITFPPFRQAVSSPLWQSSASSALLFPCAPSLHSPWSPCPSLVRPRVSSRSSSLLRLACLFLTALLLRRLLLYQAHHWGPDIKGRASSRFCPRQGLVSVKMRYRIDRGCSNCLAQPQTLPFG